MAMSAFDDAKTYLYRLPFKSDEVNPQEIIEGLVREVDLLRRSALSVVKSENQASRAEKRVEYLISVLNDLVHSKTRMTHKRLRDIQRDLAKL